MIKIIKEPSCNVKITVAVTNQNKTSIPRIFWGDHAEQIRDMFIGHCQLRCNIYKKNQMLCFFTSAIINHINKCTSVRFNQFILKRKNTNQNVANLSFFCQCNNYGDICHAGSDYNRAISADHGPGGKTAQNILN